MSYVNLNIPYTDLESGKKSAYSKLEKAVLAVSAVACIGLVACACMGAFAAPQLAAPVMSNTRAMTLPRISNAQVHQAMNRNMALVSRAQKINQVAELKKTDGRLSKIAFLGVPVLAWVGFNILGPAQNQLTDMSAEAQAKAGKAKKTTRRRGVIYQ
mmetsp:Transcript_29147/g.49424  ORF Transcript_29147/g.49424 Transcript_29147/m.49424 type:complete len:157 (+) Transcript_29147:53-523(+)